MDIPCDQCVYATPASGVRVFDLAGIRYETQLCTQHAEAFDEGLRTWAAMASGVIGPDEVVAPAVLSVAPEPVIEVPSPEVPSPREENRAALTKIRSIQERALAKARQDRPDSQQMAEGKRESLIPGLVDNWTIGFHTRMRATQRGVSVKEILEAVLNPHYTVLSKHEDAGPDVWIHHRGNIKVVVDRKAKHIRTVADKANNDDPVAVGQ